MEINGKKIREEQMVCIHTTEGKTLAGFAYEPHGLIKVFNKIPLLEGWVIGISEFKLSEYDLSLNPLKIFQTIQSGLNKTILGDPGFFKESEIKEINFLKEVKENE